MVDSLKSTGFLLRNYAPARTYVLARYFGQTTRASTALTLASEPAIGPTVLIFTRLDTYPGTARDCHRERRPLLPQVYRLIFPDGWDQGESMAAS